MAKYNEIEKIAKKCISCEEHKYSATKQFELSESEDSLRIFNTLYEKNASHYTFFMSRNDVIIKYLMNWFLMIKLINLLIGTSFDSSWSISI